MWGLAEDWGWKSYNLFMAISLQGSSWQRLSTGIYLISVCFPPWSRTEGWGHRSRHVASLESLFMLGGEHCCWCPAAGLLLETFLSCYVPDESCEWLSCCQHLCSLGQPLSPASSSICCLLNWPTAGSLYYFLRGFLDWKIACAPETCASRKVDGVVAIPSRELAVVWLLLLLPSGLTLLRNHLLGLGFHPWAESSQDTCLGRFPVAQTKENSNMEQEKWI